MARKKTDAVRDLPAGTERIMAMGKGGKLEFSPVFAGLAPAEPLVLEVTSECAGAVVPARQVRLSLWGVKLVEMTARVLPSGKLEWQL